MHVHCTRTMHHSPLFHTAQSRHRQGAPTCRIWCGYLKVSLNRRTPRQKHYPPAARAAYTTQERHPQWILSWYSVRVTCEFVVVGASRLTCRCVRIFWQALTGRHVQRATCCWSTPNQHHHRSGGSMSRTVPCRSRSDQQFSCYSQKSLDIQTAYLKCRSQTPSNPPTTHRLQ